MVDIQVQADWQILDTLGTDSWDFLPSTCQLVRLPLALDGDTFSLDFADKCFDLVVCSVLSPHISAKQVLAEYRRVLRDEGLLLIQDALASNDKRIAPYVKALERLRDSDYQGALPDFLWRKICTELGIELEKTERYTERVSLFKSHSAYTALQHEQVQVLLLRAPQKAADWLNAEQAGTEYATYQQHWIRIWGRKIAHG